MKALDSGTVNRLRAFAHRLVDPGAARVAVAPSRQSKGYWFGGGNMALGPDGRLYLSGRFRNAGDSRTGLDLGDRGKELAIYSSADGGLSWRKELALDKAAVTPGLRTSAMSVEDRAALSIEGSALRFTDRGVELFVSSEKRAPYPDPVSAYRKSGTGVWTIERLSAPDIAGLSGAEPKTFVRSDDPATLQVKDPYLWASPDGTSILFFCHHSFNWSSSSTGYLRLDEDGRPSGSPVYDCYRRGPAWDVAITRGTCALPLPPTIAPAGAGLVFYDGGECLRNLDEHEKSVKRPRGYSCEELGGLGYYVDGNPTEFERISSLFPEFVSPDGSGSIRYVDVLSTEDAFIATWQQSRPDGSQALMINSIPTR